MSRYNTPAGIVTPVSTYRRSAASLSFSAIGGLCGPLLNRSPLAKDRKNKLILVFAAASGSSRFAAAKLTLLLRDFCSTGCRKLNASGMAHTHMRQ